jgi:hypothetical protein
MVAAYYPDFTHNLAWAADPNDPQATPVYTDMTATVRDIDAFPRGRQYELAQSRVFASRVTFRDPNEYLNAVNTSSPYYPFVQPYRHMVSQAVWPKGSTGNLLNLNNWRVPADGSFESYAVGETPGFLTNWVASGGDPVVTTTNPQQGTQDLTYDVPTNADNRYGIVWNVPCVPGTQYTTSAYVRQSSASTQVIRIADQVLAADSFNRTTASGLGTAAAPLAIGGAWALQGGAASQWSTAPATPYSSGYAQVAVNATSSSRFSTLPTQVRDVRVRRRFSVPAIATGAAFACEVVARADLGANTMYLCGLLFDTDQTVQLRVIRRVAGADTTLSTYDLEGIYYQPGDEFYLDFYVTGKLLRAAAWRSSSPAVDIEDEPQIAVSDASITGTGVVGWRDILSAGNTNTLPVEFRTYNFSAIGSVEGTTTTTTGSYVRLSVTYTATAPEHEVTLTALVGTATAGTVNVDAIMHEAAATAGTFTDTGSTVYPVGAPYVERWPRRYEDAGFLGICQAECVDALAALASISLPSDYDYELLYTRPDYFWPLSGGANSTLYPDATGNNNPPLGLNISKFGVGELPAGGAAMGIPGGAGATGVTFTPPSSPSGSTLAATVLGTGPLGEAPQQPFVVPASLTGVNGIWRMTAACWVRASSNGASQTAFYPSKNVGSSAGQAFIPLYMDVDGGSGTAYQNVDTAGAVHVLTSGDGLSGIDLLDGQPHLLIGITVQDTAGDTTVYRYIDDVLDGVDTATTASLGGALRGQTDSLSVGATDDGARFLAVLNGAMTRLAVWNRELSPTETARLYQAGQGFPGELSSDRVERHFAQGGFYGPRRISGSYSDLTYVSGDPVTTMQAPSWSGRIDLLTDTQNTTAAEGGTFWAGPDGYAMWEARVLRYLRLTPTWVLGEDTAAGEIPYGGGVAFDYDPTFVYGDVSATRPGGATAVGGLAADVAATNRRYFPRNYGLSADFADDQQAQDCADWTFYSHRAPNLRVEGVTVNPVANPALWHFALSVEIGHRVTMKRRAKAANGGAGLTMSADYFVEQVRPHSIDFARGTYLVDLQLSPIGAGPGPTMQPWILEDATLSVLDSTTTLGW